METQKTLFTKVTFILPPYIWDQTSFRKTPKSVSFKFLPPVDGIRIRSDSLYVSPCFYDRCDVNAELCNNSICSQSPLSSVYSKHVTASSAGIRHPPSSLLKPFSVIHPAAQQCEIIQNIMTLCRLDPSHKGFGGLAIRVVWESGLPSVHIRRQPTYCNLITQEAVIRSN